jgi:hypothetical protein
VSALQGMTACPRWFSGDETHPASRGSLLA